MWVAVLQLLTELLQGIFPTNGISCNTGLMVLISCEFNISLKGTNTQGSPLLCDSGGYCNPTSMTSQPSNDNSTIRTITIVAIVALVLLAVAYCSTCIAVAACFMVPGCICYKKRKAYKLLVNSE